MEPVTVKAAVKFMGGPWDGGELEIYTPLTDLPMELFIDPGARKWLPRGGLALVSDINANRVHLRYQEGLDGPYMLDEIWKYEEQDYSEALYAWQPMTCHEQG